MKYTEKRESYDYLNTFLKTLYNVQHLFSIFKSQQTEQRNFLVNEETQYLIKKILNEIPVTVGTNKDICFKYCLT